MANNSTDEPPAKKHRQEECEVSMILGAAAGSCHSMVLTAGGVFTFGCGDAGRLGHGADEDEDPRNELVPRHVDGPLAKSKVVAVAAGTDHAAVCNAEGRLYTFGYGGTDGRLGYAEIYEEQGSSVPRLVLAREGSISQKVLGVSAGSEHTAAWTEEGLLHIFGKSCAYHHPLESAVPGLVEALVGKRVVGATAGNEYTAAWTEAGELYTFGMGGCGVLGHGGEDQEMVPRLVEGLVGKKVHGASASISGAHTTAWTEEGELYTFGEGTDGRLGHGGEQNEYLPRKVQGLAGKKVLGATAGVSHTAAWTEEGELYTFGNGGEGRLGHGDQTQESVPRLVESLVGKKVVCATSYSHTLAWTKEGVLFSWGPGWTGMLGHGGERNELLPRPLPATAFEI